jgi:chromosome segregation ATPase
MKSNRIIKGITGGLLALLIGGLVSCGPAREGDRRTDRDEARYETREQTVEQLDTRIRDLNEDFASVEQDLRSNGRVAETDVRDSWQSLESRREALNTNIDRYNAAVMQDAELEAARIRSEIERQVDELESGLENFRDEFALDTDRGDDGRGMPN